MNLNRIMYLKLNISISIKYILYVYLCIVSRCRFSIEDIKSSRVFGGLLLALKNYVNFKLIHTKLKI